MKIGMSITTDRMVIVDCHDALEMGKVEEYLWLYNRNGDGAAQPSGKPSFFRINVFPGGGFDDSGTVPTLGWIGEKSLFQFLEGSFLSLPIGLYCIMFKESNVT